MKVDILVYHGKIAEQFWLVDTPARRDKAMQALFKQLDNWGVYHAAGDVRYLAHARDGNIRAIKGLLEAHNGYEYESWDIEHAEIAE
jgi:hypothetical protein